MMKPINLPLAKWATNSEELNAIWKAKGQNVEAKMQVLGVSWNTGADCLHIDMDEVISKLNEGPTTKRKLLQTTASFYDTLGLFSPMPVVGKVLFQDTWCWGINSNELLPIDLGTRRHAWVSGFSPLSHIHVPRWLATSMKQSCQPHIFCDASERAYGAALYIRSTEGNNTLVRLACSKNRLAPVKRVTLPRLELLAALVGTQLLSYSCEATGYDTTRATLWTDTTVSLSWIRSDPNSWKTFVCNRVTEIQSHTSPMQWRHCPGQENPADHLKRGLLMSQIQSLDIWWHGPSWLGKHEEYWPSGIFTAPRGEEKDSSHVLVATISASLIDASKFSSYWKLVRTTAWVLPFLQNVQTCFGSSEADKLSRGSCTRVYHAKSQTTHEASKSRLHCLRNE
jgi:hypothetical protein